MFLLSSRDRCRTVVNVLGDSIGAAIVYKYSEATLRKLDEGNSEDTSDLDSIEKNAYPSGGYSSGGPAYSALLASNITTTTNI
jgi:hypothetical protein